MTIGSDRCHCQCGCERTVAARRWVLCRPCAKGYHYAPCATFEPDHQILDPATCRTCGYPEKEHA